MDPCSPHQLKVELLSAVLIIWSAFLFIHYPNNNSKDHTLAGNRAVAYNSIVDAKVPSKRDSTLLSHYCAPGATFKKEMIQVDDNVSLRIITFTPGVGHDTPAIVFLAGMASVMSGWKNVLQEMTKDYVVHYVETREKKSSRCSGVTDYGIEATSRDISVLISRLGLKRGNYVLFGYSLGATCILDCCRFLKEDPLCIVLLVPDAAFRVRRLPLTVIWIAPPFSYPLLKPIIKWYIRTYRFGLASDTHQYMLTLQALDEADPRKLKKSMLAISDYEVWNYLEMVRYPTFIIGASRDAFHDAADIQRLESEISNCVYRDLETSQALHSPAVVEEIRKYIAGL